MPANVCAAKVKAHGTEQQRSRAVWLHTFSLSLCATCNTALRREPLNQTMADLAEGGQSRAFTLNRPVNPAATKMATFANLRIEEAIQQDEGEPGAPSLRTKLMQLAADGKGSIPQALKCLKSPAQHSRVEAAVLRKSRAARGKGTAIGISHIKRMHICRRAEGCERTND
eukprot:5350430-Pleurochrysis_carterae.AAC.3